MSLRYSVCSSRVGALGAISLFVGVASLGAQQKARALPGTRPDTVATKSRPGDPPGDLVPKTSYGVIDGLVTDTSLVPLRGARISILRTTLSVGTGPNGRFRIVDVPSGQYIVIVRRAGFHPTSAVLQVSPLDTLRLSYTMEEAPAELATVTVTEKRESFRMLEFEYRRKIGEGEFMTQAQIDQHNPPYATELFRYFGTIDVAPTSGGGGQDVYYPVSRRATGGMTPTGQATCFMTVIIDNVPMPAPFNLDLLPSPRDMAGIEVYAGAATIPLQYAGFNRNCGLILVWTKDGFSTNPKP
jgi:hypothetical protein